MRGSNSGPLFCLADGSAVKTEVFTRQLKGALAFCDLDCSSYKSHSFRIGAASLAAENGMSDVQIRGLGRWKCDAFKLYIRSPTAWATINIMVKLKHYVSKATLITVYYSLIYPYLTYACTLWGIIITLHCLKS